MEASDIGASRVLVGEYDGFVHGSNSPTTFGPIMQTPDGRLYVVPTTASNEYLHVIDRPDEPGTACKLKQHAINPVSYTHLDVYKRQQRQREVARLLRPSVSHGLPSMGPRR